MARRKRKKVFTLMMVPDQAQDPRSYSISYTRGRVLLGIGCVLILHILYGGYNYFRTHQLKQKTRELTVENESLSDQVKKIDDILRGYEDVVALREKILTGFGTVLGASAADVTFSESAAIDPLEENLLMQPPLKNPPYELHNSITFLEDRGGKSFNPAAWPNRLPVEGFLTTHFQKGGYLLGRSHYGIDIAARSGTQIRAAGAGVVVMADWTPDFGNVVLISHTNGFYTYYAHAQRLLVRQGWTVRKGQIIALLGSSGISSAPHLHFEIWKDGEPIDPADMLIAMRKPSE